MKVDNNRQRAISKADPLTTTQEVAEELSINRSMVIWHLKQIGKVKQLNKWMSHELTKNQKNCHFEMSSSLTLCNKEQRILWDCDVPQKWILYKNW